MGHLDLLKSPQRQTLCPRCQKLNQCAMAENPGAKTCWCMQMNPTTIIQVDDNKDMNGKVCLCQACLTRK